MSEKQINTNTLIEMTLLAKAYSSINARDRVAQIVGEALDLPSLCIATFGDRSNVEFQVMIGEADWELFSDFWTGYQLQPTAIGSDLLKVLSDFTAAFLDYKKSLDVLSAEVLDDETNKR